MWLFLLNPVDTSESLTHLKLCSPYIVEATDGSTFFNYPGQKQISGVRVYFRGLARFARFFLHLSSINIVRAYRIDKDRDDLVKTSNSDLRTKLKWWRSKWCVDTSATNSPETLLTLIIIYGQSKESGSSETLTRKWHAWENLFLSVLALVKSAIDKKR